MSDQPINPETPIDPVPPTSSEGIAERYVERELVESRASLRRTQIIGAIVTVLVVGSVTALTAGWRSNLEPTAAAEITTGLASQRVDDLTPQFANYVREEVPKAIRSAPDEFIKRMPEYREQLENRVETDIRARSAEASKRLHDELTAFLESHKDAVGQLLKAGNDPEAATTLGQGLEDEFRKFLKEEQVGDSTIQAKLDETLKTLTLVEKRTARLAANQGLSPSEQKARHAVAMLMKRIDSAQAASGPITLPKIDPDQARAIVNDATEGIKAHVDEAVDRTKAMLPSGGAAVETEETTDAPATAAPAPNPAGAHKPAIKPQASTLPKPATPSKPGTKAL